MKIQPTVKTERSVIVKYDVMVRIEKRSKQIMLDNGYDPFTHPSSQPLNVEDFCPSEWAGITIKEMNKYDRVPLGGVRFGKIRPIEIRLFHNYQFKKWEYLKTIEVDDGELRVNDYYEIDGEKCSFEIVYNDENDRVELRVDYVKDIVDCDLNKIVDSKYAEYDSILQEYHKAESLKKEIKQQVIDEMGDRGASHCKTTEGDEVGPITRLFTKWRHGEQIKDEF